MFPDAVSARASSTSESLTGFTRGRAVMLYVVQRADGDALASSAY